MKFIFMGFLEITFSYYNTMTYSISPNTFSFDISKYLSRNALNNFSKVSELTEQYVERGRLYNIFIHNIICSKDKYIYLKAFSREQLQDIEFYYCRNTDTKLEQLLYDLILDFSHKKQKTIIIDNMHHKSLHFVYKDTPKAHFLTSLYGFFFFDNTNTYKNNIIDIFWDDYYANNYDSVVYITDIEEEKNMERTIVISTDSNAKINNYENLMCTEKSNFPKYGNKIIKNLWICGIDITIMRNIEGLYNLKTITLKNLFNVTQIDNGFLFGCSNLTAIDLSPLSNVTQIGCNFLSICRNLTTIDLSPLSNVTQIGDFFLSGCEELTTIDLSPLSNVTQFGKKFTYRCNLITIIIGTNNIINYEARYFECKKIQKIF